MCAARLLGWRGSLRCRIVGNMRILGMPGSLRSGSSNHALLSAIERVSGEHKLELYDSVGRLPHFSPDADQDPPAPVLELRALVGAADALVISSPEYAHGIPGSLKNALDWLVSSPVMIDKPTAVWTAGPGESEFAHPQLLEVLRTMSARIPREACLVIGRARQAFDAEGNLVEPTLVPRHRGCDRFTRFSPVVALSPCLRP
jgi:chromate reductase, NAD(P)H dehydrogenase (quinone)